MNATHPTVPTINAALNSASGKKPWYRHPWPWLLMLGPAIVVAAGIHTAWLAFSRQDALVVDDYYKQGKAINQDLRRDRAAARLRLAASLRYEPARGVLTGSVAGLAGPQTARMTMRLVHSTQPEKDILLRIAPDAQGRFSAPLPMLEKARWQVLVENEGRDWRLNGAWTWPQQQSITLKAE